jgi:hypothetical protein
VVVVGTRSYPKSGRAWEKKKAVNIFFYTLVLDDHKKTFCTVAFHHLTIKNSAISFSHICDFVSSPSRSMVWKQKECNFSS